MNVTSFQRALSTRKDGSCFAHVPVDWWDAHARRWRPTTIVAALEDDIEARATVLAPFPHHSSPGSYLHKRVHVRDLRASQLLTPAIAGFLSTRYTLELLDALQPALDRCSLDDRDGVAAARAELAVTESGWQREWATAFIEGESEGVGVSVPEWDEQPLSGPQLPDPGSGDPRTLYAAIDTERARGEICCSPVAHWDDADGRWRPTVIVGATSDAGQFSPTADVRILVPGDVVRCETVSGSTLQPLDLEDTPFSLFAVPVVARDVLRLHESLRTAGLDPAQIAGHPVLVGLVELLQGAAGEWMDAWERGLDGPAPRPVVVALSPGLWGFSDEDQPATVWERAAD